MNKKTTYGSLVLILIHAISWIVLFAIPFFLRPDFSAMKPDFWHAHKHDFIIMGIVNRIIWVCIFYLNTKILYPHLVYKQKYTSYISAILLCLVVPLIIDNIIFRILLPGVPYILNNFISFNLYPIIFILVASSFFRLIIDRIEADKRNKDRLNENLKTELSLLRSQVSPHFMFNVLNNMVALARKKSDQLEPSLIKLSQLLRYMLYETEHKVSLDKEVEYLKSYIDLQKQRFGSMIKYEHQFDIGDGNLLIEPMLLIPFVENAFKHGTVLVNNPEILIQLSQTNDTISLCVKNKFSFNEEIKDTTQGIGLENVKRRLDLLYPESHNLSIVIDDQWYIVNLEIKL